MQDRAKTIDKGYNGRKKRGNGRIGYEEAGAKRKRWMEEGRNDQSPYKTVGQQNRYPIFISVSLKRWTK